MDEYLQIRIKKELKDSAIDALKKDKACGYTLSQLIRDLITSYIRKAKNRKVGK